MSLKNSSLCSSWCFFWRCSFDPHAPLLIAGHAAPVVSLCLVPASPHVTEVGAGAGTKGNAVGEGEADRVWSAASDGSVCRTNTRDERLGKGAGPSSGLRRR